MKKALTVVVLALVLMFAFTACSQPAAAPEASADAAPPASEEAPSESAEATPEASEEASEEAPAASGDELSGINPETGEPWKIGFSAYGQSNEFAVIFGDAARAKGEELGVTVDLLDAEYDVNKQLSQLETFITNSYDAIIMAPVDASSMDTAMEQIVDAGIPLICFNVNVEDTSYLDSFVGSDDVEVGEEITKYACDAIGGEGKVVVIQGQLGMSAEVDRTTGIDNALANYPNIEELARKDANWSREEGMSTMENWIQSFGGDIDAVIAENDEMALGAIQALEASGLADDVVVVGVDGLSDAITSIANGMLDCTYLQDGEGQGSMAVEVAVRILNGGTVDSTYMIPWAQITSENVADFEGRR
ncbi:MAG: substrate-binding domain-containing protein [Christensenellaceae bacterium]|jgi:inositol transport system substrate-binding protein